MERRKEYCNIRVDVSTREMLKTMSELTGKHVYFYLHEVVERLYIDRTSHTAATSRIISDIQEAEQTPIKIPPKILTLEERKAMLDAAGWGDDEDTMPNPPDYVPDFDEIDHGKMQRDAFSNGYATTEYAFKEWQQTPEYLEKAADWEAYKTLD